MAAFINTNIASLNSQRNLNASQTALTTSLQRLSSGLRINSAKDDAAGLAISERMTSQINGSDQAARNANDGISLAQTAEGDMAQIGTNLQRMRELAVQASNGTNSDSDRAALNGEVKSLAAEIDRVAQNSSFNGVKLLDGSFSAQDFQIGANNTSNDRITISSIGSARTTQLGSVGTSYAATLAGAATTTALAAGDVTLNGFQVGASTIGSAPGQSAASAFSVAAAINKISSSSGVTATANTNTVVGSGAPSVFTAITAGTFSINGIDIGAVAAGTTAAGQGANVAAAINNVAVQTGVTASADATTGKLSLTAADGRDISIGMGGTGADAAAATAAKATLATQTGLAVANIGNQAITAGAVAAAAVNNHGTITLNSSSSAGIVYGGANLAYAGLTAAGGTVSATTTSSVSSIATMDVLTAANANKALSAIDGALATVNSSRASLGAYQNRFASVVSSLQTSAENLSASRSRIQDTDFAKETASLTRGQILQQAGTAMLAQANSLPNGVLALLRG
jgi:flagellin